MTTPITVTDDNGSKGKSGSANTSGATSASNPVCDEDDRRDDDQRAGWKDNGNGHCPLIWQPAVDVRLHRVG